MGASVSVGRLLEELTAEELAESVGSIGRPFQQYGAAILEESESIDGKDVSKMSADELEDLLDDLGVSKRTHRKEITRKLRAAREESGRGARHQRYQQNKLRPRRVAWRSAGLSAHPKPLPPAPG